MIIQTLALFLDAYRELNAKKLFWITLAISLVTVAAFACVGLNDRGVSFVWWTFDNGLINAKQMSPAAFYRFIFATIAIPIWLSWGATILALISTASIVPDFVTGGTIELSLSKPIGRVRLILTKYLSALTFVALQVAVFSAACFAVIGFRAGSWDVRLLLAVPIVLLFFSYLYCVCAIVGLLTRSTIAAILLTAVFWLVVFGVHAAENLFLVFKVYNQERHARITALIETAEAQRARQVEQAEENGAAPDAAVIAASDGSIAKRQAQLEETKENSTWLVRGHAIAYAVKSVLPKTRETIDLLGRYLLTADEFRRFEGDQDQNFSVGADDVRVSQKRVQSRVQEELRSRTIGWVVGTSLLFEGAVVGLMCWLFSRKDY